MKKVIYTLFSILFLSTWANAQVTSSLIMNPNPPTVALDWLKEPQPIKLLVTNTSNSDLRGIRAVVDVKNVLTGAQVISSTYQKGIPIDVPKMGTKMFFGTDLFNQNSFDVNTSQINLTSGSIKPGNYRICIKLVTSQGVEVTQFACANFQVTEFQEPILQLQYHK